MNDQPEIKPVVSITHLPAIVWIVEGGRRRQYLRGVGQNVPLFSENRDHALIIKDESVARKVENLLTAKNYGPNVSVYADSP